MLGSIFYTVKRLEVIHTPVLTHDETSRLPHTRDTLDTFISTSVVWAIKPVSFGAIAVLCLDLLINTCQTCNSMLKYKLHCSIFDFRIPQIHTSENNAFHWSSICLVLRNVIVVTLPC